MTHRSFCEHLPQPGPEQVNPRVVLAGAEARHLSSVLRLGPGDPVELFDGQGVWARAEIVGESRREVELVVHELEHEPPGDGPEVVLATAVPKGDRVRSLVEKATELGVDRLVPLRTQRSVVHPRDGKQKKMRQAVISACKQCGRNRLMQIDPLTAWTDLLAVGDQSLVMAQRGGLAAIGELEKSLDQSTGSLVLCVGPEGGWTDQELAAAVEMGATMIGLGRHVLRIETAAVALASLVAVQIA